MAATIPVKLAVAVAGDKALAVKEAEERVDKACSEMRAATLELQDALLRMVDSINLKEVED